MYVVSRGASELDQFYAVCTSTSTSHVAINPWSRERYWQVGTGTAWNPRKSRRSQLCVEMQAVSGTSPLVLKKHLGRKTSWQSRKHTLLPWQPAQTPTKPTRSAKVKRLSISTVGDWNLSSLSRMYVSASLPLSYLPRATRIARYLKYVEAHMHTGRMGSQRSRVVDAVYRDWSVGWVVWLWWEGGGWGFC